MNKEVIKKYFKEFTHWVNGGEVYYTSIHWTDDTWYKINPTENDSIWEDDFLLYVIKDKHFEARKAHALGEEIEHRNRKSALTLEWTICKNPLWYEFAEYRPKPKKKKTIVFEEWVIYFTNENIHEIVTTDDIDNYVGTNEYQTVKVQKLSERTVEIEEDD